MRTEKDFLGLVSLADDCLYGAQTARAKENFALDYKRTNIHLVRALILVKKAAALSFAEIEKDNAAARNKYNAIDQACDTLLAGDADDMFVVDALQGGAGTSTHMNVNEVIANTALGILGAQAGRYDLIHPLDDVNRFQSTNDVYPTALRIASILLLRELSAECAALQEALQKKENQFERIKKLGRTELMDAVPITLGSAFGAYAQAIARDRWRLYKVEERLRQVNIGGAAVGLIENNDKTLHALKHRYSFLIIEKLRELSGIGLAAAEYPMDITQNNDVFVEVSGLLKALSVNLSKIAGDLRLMNSGPNGGLMEIKLAPMQAGSTIMPGKVNPVIPEMVMQCAIKAQANDYSITMAASRGEFELNAFLPLIADSLLESFTILKNACFIFRTKCIDTLEANEERCKALLDASCAFAASYVPTLGYDAVSDIVHEHHGDSNAIKASLPTEGEGRKP
ncbi:MAG: aspartate ammonia-lyase [Spirochaetaceae bacterium]|jgi:aspartate ammonia-lyase|nr:aspartate ammonia-lyase [Spirochaetaceae bacterium]